MKITKAIITAAGFGSRFLPYSKSIQKEMLPILNKPMIDYIVDDCVKAGISEIIFIVNKKTRSQIELYYSDDIELDNYLVRMGKLEKRALVGGLSKKAKFTYIEQDNDGEYGTAVPLKLSRKYVENEDAFLLLMGDDFIYNQDGSSEIQRMIEEFEFNHADALVGATRVPLEIINKYGAIKYIEDKAKLFLKGVIEKPEPSKAPSNLVCTSKYIFKPSVYGYIEKQTVNKKFNEWFLTDTLCLMCENERLLVYESKGKYLDTGYILGWLLANITVALGSDSLRDELLKELKTYLV